jgi:hypothetical protein
MFNFFWKIMITCSVIALTGCVSIDGPYTGKVIDAETNLPIEGAVVDGAWYKKFIGGGSEYYDSSEVVTDKNGEFKMGKGLMIHSIFYYVKGVMFTIFKAEYTGVEPTYWSSMENLYTVTSKGELKKLGRHELPPESSRLDIPNRHELAWQGDKAIFKLHRMTLEQRRKRTFGGLMDVPSEKRRLFHYEIFKEQIEIGEFPPDTKFELPKDLKFPVKDTDLK